MQHEPISVLNNYANRNHHATLVTGSLSSENSISQNFNRQIEKIAISCDLLLPIGTTVAEANADKKTEG
jgi:hypothetical protein